MKLYNSLKKSIEEFQPVDQQITIYTCGPTVYERAHIGNLASFIYADTLKRTLMIAFPDRPIKHVMNITDVDDKTIATSRTKYPDLSSMDALNKLTREYEQLFKDDLTRLGIDIPSITFVRATENTDAMQKLIRELLDAGFAYTAEDGIYFNTLKYSNDGIDVRGKPQYGILAPTAIQGLITEAQRTDHDEYEKHEAIDFVLWKAQKDGEPAWDFDLDGKNIKGRPGWHIECSAMSTKYLGQPFDIHTGGVDLKFPHHENEIAQSKGANGEDLVRFFFHSEHMLIDGKKMSKSLNNFITLEDIKNKGYNPLAFRLLVLQSHYQNLSHFSWENLESAQSTLNNLYSWVDQQFQSSINPLIDEEEGYFKKIVRGWLMDDLRTPLALVTLTDRNVQGRPSAELIRYMDSLFGIGFSNRQDISSGNKTLIRQRETARQSQDWQKADELRKELAERGIEINDTPLGPVWFRK